MLKFKLLTPEKLIAELDVESVTMPGDAGQLTVLEGHDLLATGLRAGDLYALVRDADGKLQRESYVIGAGVAEVNKKAASVFVATAEKA